MLRNQLAFVLFAVLPACTESLAADERAIEVGSSTFYEIYASPADGGYFVSRVNCAWTTCADGWAWPWCFVDEVDEPLVADRDVIVRGAIVPGGKFGRLEVDDVWLAGAAAGEPAGVGVLVEQTGIRCVQAPCEDKRERRLNSDGEAFISDLDFTPSGATDEEIGAAMDALTFEGGGGLLVFGHRYHVANRGNVARARTVTQFYTRVPDDPAAAPISPEECEAIGGFVRPDIGDGRIQCEPGEDELGRVAIGIEGGVCCARP